LILYDTTNKKSFKNAELIPETIYKIKDLTLTEIFPMLLVGTKNDLVDLRQVSYHRGTELAEHFDTNFFETSSKTQKNCDEVFLSLLKEMELFKNKKETTQSTCITM
jgi:GTPase KRas